MTDKPRPMKTMDELTTMSADDFLKELDAIGDDIKRRDTIGKLRQATDEYAMHVRKMEKDTELLLNLAGQQLKEEALAEARRVDRSNRLMDTIDRIDREDDQLDEPTKK